MQSTPSTSVVSQWWSPPFSCPISTTLFHLDSEFTCNSHIPSSPPQLLSLAVWILQVMIAVMEDWEWGYHEWYASICLWQQSCWKFLGKTCSYVYPLCHVVRKLMYNYTWWTGNEATTSGVLQYARTASGTSLSQTSLGPPLFGKWHISSRHGNLYSDYEATEKITIREELHC